MEKEAIQQLIDGEVSDDIETRSAYRRDTSLFEKTPALVVFPKTAEDVSKVVKYVHAEKEKGEDVSIAARAAGTDMTGGSLTNSISLVCTKFLNRIISMTDTTLVTEPGVYYRDFEKVSEGKIIPSYPASKELCAIGGMVANNAGGELTLTYGQTERYVQELDVVLSDGSMATFHPLSTSELAEKKSKSDLEGTIYRDIEALIRDNKDEIENARPKTSKNSAGYYLWNVIDEAKGTFDLTKLIVGSQGTLGIVTKATIGIVKPKTERSMLIVFLKDLETLPEIVKRVLEYHPESFESYDDQTFKLAIKFLPQILSHVGFLNSISLGLSFIPEVGMVLRGGVPKLVLMAEFAEDTKEHALGQAEKAREALRSLDLETSIARNEREAAKYWTIRRESFSLLRKNLRGYYAAPFIDDFVVDPSTYPKFLPEMNALLKEYRLIYTIAGHIGNGNFHIIPLMNLDDPKSKQIILELAPKVYALVSKYGGSITGEHNDGIIRTPYLHMMYTEKMLGLFERVKKIFDPLNILNPGKKVGGTEADIDHFMITKS